LNDLKASTTWNKYKKGAGWAAFGRLSSVALSTLLTFLLARVVTKAELGVYFLIVSVVTVAATLGMFGMQNSIVRLLSESIGKDTPRRTTSIVRRVLATVLISALFMALLLNFGGASVIARVVFKSALFDELSSWVALFCFSAILSQIVSQIFRGFYDIRNAVIFGGIISNGSLILLCVFGLLFNFKIDLRFALSTLILGMLISVLVGTGILWKRTARLSGGGELLTQRQLWNVSLPLFITSITFLTLKQSDLWLVGAFRLENEVAIYGAGLRLVLLISIPLNIVNSFIPPIIGELYAKDQREKLQELMRIASTMAALTAFLISIPVLLFPRWVLGIAFGPEFQVREAVLVVTFLCVGQLVGIYFGSCGQTLIMTGHERSMMIITLLTGLSTLMAGYILVQRLGTIGVAAAYSLGLMFQNFFMWRTAKSRTGLSTNASFRMTPIVVGMAQRTVNKYLGINK
jgi:O-antigen/teichoic acid export membrane protein